MDLKEYLTNEKVSKKFGSQFDLVNYAIRLAENMIVTGRDSRVKTDSQNRALQILSEILNNKDKLDDVFVQESVPHHAYEEVPAKREPSEKAFKGHENKKASKAFAK